MPGYWVTVAPNVELTDHPDIMSETQKLTEKELAFVTGVMELKNLTAAYKTVYPCGKMNEVSVRKEAQRLSQRPHVKKAIDDWKKTIADSATVTEAMVLEEWLTIARADHRELVSLRIDSCRHCHSVDHAYHWRNEAEYLAELNRELESAKRAKREPAYPDLSGGFGFRKKEPPHPDCPECDGDGVPTTVIPDLSKVSPAAAKLYAGLKQTKDGLEIKMRDQDAAWVNLGKYLGMYHDRLPGKANGNPVIPTNVTVTAKTPAEAARIYKEIMG